MEPVYILGARVILLLHLLFILYAVLGALLLPYRSWTVWTHLPAAIWASGISFLGWICPLTPLEKWFLNQARYPAYDGSFIEYYLLNIIYPGDLTRTLQVGLGLFILTVNVLFYWKWLRIPGQSDSD